MSQTDWIAEQQDAYDDLLEDGVLFTFTREGKGKFDPITSTNAPGEDQTFTAPGIVKLMSPTTNKVAQAWQAQGLIKSGDEMLLIGCGTYTPELEDRVDLDGVAWAVKGMTTFRPGIVPLLNYLLVRKV